ncbi:Beta-lactamase [Dyadobacter sp. SG02]|nr:serine hydrolase domain-containing protein [Dyadobacter sp. SG02]SEI50226.1 Beta-lactamase [Dyadobacter sp. SG02]
MKELITEEREFDDHDINKIGFNFPPGSDFEYSNSGYVILRRIAEVVSGKMYSDLIAQLIFEPLQMNSSRVAAHITAIPGFAVGYKDAYQKEPDLIKYSLRVVDGAGPIYFTSPDLKRLIEGIYSQKFLLKASRDNMRLDGVK